MLIMPLKAVQILIATTVDATNKLVFVTDYYKPIKTNASYKLLAKTLDGFSEIVCRIGIINDYAYDLKLSNNYTLRVFKPSLIYAYNLQKFVSATEALNIELLCDITYKTTNSSYLHKLQTDDIELINAIFIKFAKNGQYPYLTSNYIKNKEQAYKGKKVTVIDVREVGIVREKVAIIERTTPIVNVIYYM